MRGFNKVMLCGNLTSDPEVRTAKTGAPFSTFSLATNRGWKNKEGEQVSETDFHRVIAFGKLAEIVGSYLKKGAPVLVCGRLSNRAFTNKEGAKRYITEVVLDDVSFMPSGRRLKKGGQKATSSDATTYKEADEAEMVAL